MSLANIHLGDFVKIIAGKDKGKTGTVEKVFPHMSRVIVAGINVVKKHARPGGRYPTGGIISKSMPASSSNIMLMCPHCQRPTRISRSVTPSFQARLCKKCGQNIDHTKKSAYERKKS